MAEWQLVGVNLILRNIKLLHPVQTCGSSLILMPRLVPLPNYDGQPLVCEDQGSV